MSHHASQHHRTVNVLVPIADGSEELETVSIVDILVRGGVKVTTASVSSSLQVTCSRGVKLVADAMIEDCTGQDWDLIACPGGLPGANHLRDSHALTQLLQRQQAQNKYLAAICASPAVVLHHHKLLDGKHATCYPVEKFSSQLSHFVNEPVVVDGHVITSQSPGTATLFALKLVEILMGTETAAQVAKELVLPHH